MTLSLPFSARVSQSVSRSASCPSHSQDLVTAIVTCKDHLPSEVARIVTEGTWAERGREVQAPPRDRVGFLCIRRYHFCVRHRVSCHAQHTRTTRENVGIFVAGKDGAAHSRGADRDCTKLTSKQASARI